MSILINMEMPKSCRDCGIEQDGFWCGALDGYQNTRCFTNERREDCPLVPVPPHGRLLDENKIFEMLEVQREDEYNKTHRPKATWSRVMDCFEDLLGIVDTAIPAEEGE